MNEFNLIGKIFFAPNTSDSDLIEKAMEASNALSSEQQAEMLEETRKSFAENNVALSRPAAPVEGLETVKSSPAAGRQALKGGDA